MKNYNHSNPNYKREKTLKLRSSLYLRLGSLRTSGKWILFFVDRVNVKLFWKSSPWITYGVAQLLSNEISKRLRQKLELSKLVEEFNTLLVTSAENFDLFLIAKAIYRGFRGKTFPKKPSIMGLTVLITWVVLDPVMGEIITETQGSSSVEMRVSALRLTIEVTLDVGLELRVWVSWWCWNTSFKLCVERLIWYAGLEIHVWAPQWCWNASFELCIELCVWDVSFKLCVWVLKWCWDASFYFYLLALQWCWDAGFEPCILALHEWLRLASRSKYGPCYVMTCLQWFLDSLQCIKTKHAKYQYY